MLRICSVLVLMVFMFTGSTLAETYKWVDEQGTVNFSEDLSQVPKKYRKKVQIRGDMGPGAQEPGEIVGTSFADKGAPSGAAGEGAQKKDVLYGGKSGDSWKMEFLRLHSDMENTNNQINELNGRLSNTSGLSRTEYLSIQNSLKNLQYHRQELERKLSALNESASRAGVPAEYR